MSRLTYVTQYAHVVNSNKLGGVWAKSKASYKTNKTNIDSHTLSTKSSRSTNSVNVIFTISKLKSECTNKSYHNMLTLAGHN